MVMMQLYSFIKAHLSIAYWWTTRGRLGNSRFKFRFKRIETENPALSIDPTAAWTTRGQHGQTEMIFQIYHDSAASANGQLFKLRYTNLASSTQNQTYTVRGVITAAMPMVFQAFMFKHLTPKQCK